MAVKRRIRRRRRRRGSPMYGVIGIFGMAIALLAFLYKTESTALMQASTLATSSSEEPALELGQANSKDLPVQPTGGGGGIDPRISTKTVTYQIWGTTAQELRQQMQQKGPDDGTTGSRFDGFTRWTVDWDYQYQTVGGLCQLDQIDVRADVTITLPKWDATPDAAVGLSDRWSTYIQALTLHENGHREHAIRASQGVLQALKSLPSMNSCDGLTATAEQQAREIVQTYAQQDVVYDQQTHHGAAQGAVFP